jgi:anti-sigma-K factor RskA
MNDCEHRMDAAAYVLGALEDPEGYREHLATCASCRAEVAELQSVVDLLGEAVKPVTASRAMRARIMEGVRAEAELLHAAGERADHPPAPARTRRLLSRPLWLPAGAAALAAGLAAALALALSGGSSSPTTVHGATLAASETGAQVVLVERGHRGELVLRRMRPAPPGQIFEVWLKRSASGAPVPTDALFGVTHGGNASVNVPGDLRRVREILVTHEPLGGSLHPTSEPLLHVAA